jgi:hypothetical protein
MTCRSLGAHAALACLLALTAAAPAHADVPGAEIVKRVNALRAAEGIPAVAHDRRHSERCRLHDEYMQQSGHGDHVQIDTMPGATPEGAIGGVTSSLAFASWPETNGNPWANAPLHLSSSLFDPSHASLGAHQLDRGGKSWNCLGSSDGATAPAPAQDIFYSVPGDGRSVPAAQLVYEFPYGPQVPAGLPPTQITGPNILVFHRAPETTLEALGVPAYIVRFGASPVAATIAGPSGPVATRLVAAGTDRASGSPPATMYGAPNSGYLIPVRPLAPNSAYTATVKWRTVAEGIVPSRTLTQRFSFRTTGQYLHGNNRRCAWNGRDGCVQAARKPPEGLPLQMLVTQAGKNVRLRYHTTGPARGADAVLIWRNLMVGRSVRTRVSLKRRGTLLLRRACRPQTPLSIVLIAKRGGRVMTSDIAHVCS